MEVFTSAVRSAFTSAVRSASAVRSGFTSAVRSGFTSFLKSQSAPPNRSTYDSLKNFSPISPQVQTHMMRVYLSLFCTLVAAAVGVYLHMLWNIGGLFTVIGCIGCIIWLHLIPPSHEQKKFSLLMVIALLQGASNGTLYVLAYNIDPSIPICVFVGCTLAFGCFSGAAIVARRRGYFYLGAVLSSGLSILLWLQFASSVFVGLTTLLKFELYIGLLLFLGYIVLDTQDIIEKADHGDLDYVKHALGLFTDFLAVFVRILIIKLENAAEKKRKEEKGPRIN